MKLTQELIDVFLMQADEMRYALHRHTGEIVLDAPESMTGEPEIDWDDEETEENLILIPQISSTEAFEIMVKFAEEQEQHNRNELLAILNRRNPFRNFKNTVYFLGLKDAWYHFENEEAKKMVNQWLEEYDLHEK